MSLADDLADVLRAHRLGRHDPGTGTFWCVAGDYVGPWLSRHQAEKLLEGPLAAHQPNRSAR